MHLAGHLHVHVLGLIMFLINLLRLVKVRDIHIELLLIWKEDIYINKQ